ncbi:MAG TPA: hypothetical protein VHB21_08505, partial [Minicystis sp.]|nr:hypothetical protein [Minicystis sp.]
MPRIAFRHISAACVVSAVAAACTPGGEQTPPAQPPPQPSGVASKPSAAPAIDPAAAEKAKELVAKNIAARGGLERLRAIRSMRLSGRVRYEDDDGTTEMAYASVAARGKGIRTERTYQGLTSIEAYDGKDAWRMRPFGGRRDPFRVSADEAKIIADDADLDGPLVDAEAKGHRLEYLGTEDVDGTEAHRIRVTLKDGDVEVHDLDPDAFLEIRVVRVSHVRGTERVTETDVGDYEEVGGVLVPFSFASGEKGGPKMVRLELDRAEANVAADDALFRFPAAGERAARAVFAGPASPERAAAVLPSTAAPPPVLDAGVLSGLGARNIGSAAMSGRVSALAAHPDGKRTTIYVGAASGGVFRSLDGGTTFKPVFDHEKVQSIGDIALDPSNPRTVWVGTGESWTRNSVSIGDGIYKSTDAGETWKNVGLPSSERIARVVVSPTNGDVVYACVPGKLWSDSADRGLYKTTDGGKTWTLVLKGPNLSTGCSGLAMDPKNPDVLFAGLWDFRRKGWTFRSGGDGPDAPSGSGLYRTADGGATWTRLDATSSKLPPGPWGRVEVAIAPSDPNRVYALIESKSSALYASTDGGKTWEARDRSQMMVWRPFYFGRLVVDPHDPDRVFKPNANLVVSTDGGKSFSATGGGGHGDWHVVWIDPTNTDHVIGGDDGGLFVSHDGGSRWWKTNNLPISQFYHVTVDAKDPYQVYGGLQDNSTWVGDSSYPGGITNSRWENLNDSDGFWAVVDPTDPNAVYVEGQGGYVSRVDRRTKTARDIQPKAGYHEKLRFNWNTPIHASPTQKGVI